MRKNYLSKAFAGFVAFGLILGMAGCGGSGAGASSAASSKAGSSAASSAVSSAAPAASTAASSEEAAEATEFKHPDGWSTRYYKKNVQLNKIDDHSTSFVYTGECAGTCMLTISYVKGKKPEEAASAISKGWGDASKIKKSEGTLPGAMEVKSVYHEMTPDNGPAGLYQTVIAGEYKEGTLVFELTYHRGNDEAMDMAANDTLAEILNSTMYY